METLTKQPEKKTNIKFPDAPKQVVKADDPTKTYEYEWIEEHHGGKPIDRDTEKPLTNPYPRVIVRPNQGTAFDEKTGKARKWRLIVGQPSIWADEQVALEKFTPKEIDQILASSENQIEFTDGKCRVSGADTMKRQALELNDAFEDKKTQYKPVKRLYRLVNPEVIIDKQLEVDALEHKARNLAYDADEDTMLGVAYAMGINVADLSEAGIKKIKSQFLAKSKYDGSNVKGREALEMFISLLENPLTKTRYIFAQGLAKSVISSTQQPGKLTWVHTREPILDLPQGTQVVEYLCKQVMESDQLVLSVLENTTVILNNLKQ